METIENALPDRGPRLRNPWLRLPLFFGVLLAAYLGAQLVMMAVSKATGDGLRDRAVLGVTLLLSAGLAGVYAMLVRALERREPQELALRNGVALAGAGMSIGLVIFLLTYALLWWMGHAQWLGFTQPAALVPALTLAILSGVGEELLFRGGVFRIVEERLGTGTALALSAALFGGVHAINPGATWLATVGIALEAGLLLGAAYTVVRNLWLPIGIHVGWNFTEGGVFGAAVSGLPARQGMVHMPLSGPDWLTGGSFGPEASVATVAVCLALTAVLLGLTLRAGNWIPGPWAAARKTRPAP